MSLHFNTSFGRRILFIPLDGDIPRGNGDILRSCSNMRKQCNKELNPLIFVDKLFAWLRGPPRRRSLAPWTFLLAFLTLHGAAVGNIARCQCDQSQPSTTPRTTSPIATWLRRQSTIRLKKSFCDLEQAIDPCARLCISEGVQLRCPASPVGQRS